MVHPRSRGDHAVVKFGYNCFHGSPPLARGPPQAGGDPRRRPRFTPARAGTTSDRVSSAFPTPVHPRSRGDHTGEGFALVEVGGSPPLARGPPVHPPANPVLRRFTPARAGTTRRPRPSPRRPTVHPRSRGDHTVGYVAALPVSGSPPLARGPRELMASVGPVDRFTPARAGTTLHLALAFYLRSVHPRSRGDHADTGNQVLAGNGSPPLARGPPTVADGWTWRQRFTPARAGTTMLEAYRKHPGPVHPRSRGDHWRDGQLRQVESGSPPLARGPRTGVRHHPVGHGFTPARAGTTTYRAPRASPPAVHPRSRGDHISLFWRTACHSGSPPLARGPRSSVMRLAVVERFTPARAGTTASGGAGAACQAVHPRSRGDHAGRGR